MGDYRNAVFYGRDCRDMNEIPDESVQMICTSPPYYGLRKYTSGREIGSEKSLQSYLDSMVSVFREAYRVLVPSGTVWLNLGDSYANSSTGGNGATGGRDKSTLSSSMPPCGTTPVGKPNLRSEGLKQKDLIGVPWRVALALQSDGWYLRSDIVWAKTNPMPSSVTDRCTSSHEYVFMLTKNPKYFFDAKGIAEPCQKLGTPAHLSGGRGVRAGTRGGLIPKQDALGKVTYTGFNKRWKDSPTPLRNKRDVWQISTKPFSGEHFAVMPWDLVDICIRAGSQTGDLVLDPFMGSGTVAAVAKALGRDYVGYDLSEEYARFLTPRIAEIGKKYQNDAA